METKNIRELVELIISKYQETGSIDTVTENDDVYDKINDIYSAGIQEGYNEGYDDAIDNDFEFNCL